MRTRMSPSRALTVMVAALVTLVSSAGVAAASELDTPDLDTSASGSGWSFKRVERCLMRKINNKRSNNGRGKLSRDRQLGYVARRHARSMANSGSVYHDGSIGNKVTRWSSLGQNTGKANGCRQLARAFWNSSSHRSNIMGTWRFHAVGVVRAGGKIWAQHIFEWRRDPGNVWSYP